MDFVLAIRQGALKRGRDIYDDCVERMLAEAPDLLGFLAQCTTYPAVIQISKKIKGRDPHVKIVIGGHNTSFVDQANPIFDSQLPIEFCANLPEADKKHKNE